MRVGLAMVLRLRPDTPGTLFLPIDQPHIDLDVLRRIVERWQASPDRVVQPRVDGRPTSPTLFPRRLFGPLGRITGDRGGAQLLRGGSDAEQAVPVDFEGDDARRLTDYDEARSFAEARRATE